MRILVLQITRFGDILCTLPVLAALRRENPVAEIHFMVRKRFAAAAENCPHINHLWRLDSAKILAPFIEGSGEVTDGLTPLSGMIHELRAQKFDRVINLSFSPSSSFITHLIAQDKIPVWGYTRTSDLFLHIPDQASQYFRAQVGLTGNNRIHVTEAMGWIAGVRVMDSDWERMGADGRPRSGVVCHLGASHEGKTWPLTSWVSLIEKIIGRGGTVTLVGGKEERSIADDLTIQVGSPPAIKNLVGETSFTELLDAMTRATLFIGADSGPLHVASLGGCRALNLSVGNVRFWETGPIVKGSRILVSEEPSFLASDTVFEQVSQMLQGLDSKQGYIECTEGAGPRYEVHPGAQCPKDFWPLTDWMYFNGARPAVGGEIATALSQIIEICTIARTQLEVFYRAPQNKEIVNVLDRLDDLLEIFRRNIAPLRPLLEAFRAQKENIPPGARDEIFYQTAACYERLNSWAGELLNQEPKRSQVLEAKG